MTNSRSDLAAWAAGWLGAFAIIANQVAGKAVRDTLFLTHFDVATLPRIVAASALLSMIVVVVASRILVRFGPRRLVPGAFFLSATVLTGFFLTWERSPRLFTVLFYLQIATLGAVLISWFWSVVSERFDPRTARQLIARIGAGGTVGGLVGGIAAERAAGVLEASSLLAGLAGLHAAAGVVTWHLAKSNAARAPLEAGTTSDAKILQETPYLRHLATLVILGTISAGLLDYVFKLRADVHFTESETLLRFFALYYTAISLATLLVQSLITERALERLGVARTAAFLPLAVTFGGVGAIFVPGFLSVAVARGLESTLRSSAFRSAYELFYSPIGSREKRATKTLVDVGFDRLGDALGAGIVQLVLWVGLAVPNVLVGLAATLGLASLGVARRLHAGYVLALERSLVSQADRANSLPVDWASKTGMLQTLTHLDLTVDLPAAPSVATASSAPLVSKSARAPQTVSFDRAFERANPLLLRALDLGSRELPRVRKALQAIRVPQPELVPFLIPLLGWDEVASTAARVLRRGCDRNVGQLVDALLDGEIEFVIRRRIPRILAHTKSLRASQGLVAALHDTRFEVRFQCALALAKRKSEDKPLALTEEEILSIVERETQVDRQIWDRHRLLDGEEAADAELPFEHEGDGSRGLQHVFNLLSLIYPRRPLIIAYRGLHTDDAQLKGTALEYLESVLPTKTQQSLWELLERQSEDRPKS